MDFQGLISQHLDWVQHDVDIDTVSNTACQNGNL